MADRARETRDKGAKDFMAAVGTGVQDVMRLRVKRRLVLIASRPGYSACFYTVCTSLPFGGFLFRNSRPTIDSRFVLKNRVVLSHISYWGVRFPIQRDCELDSTTSGLYQILNSLRGAGATGYNILQSIGKEIVTQPVSFSHRPLIPDMQGFLRSLRIRISFVSL